MYHYSLYTGSRTLNLQIPEKNLLYIAEHPYTAPALSEEALFEESLDHPIGCKGLEDIPADTKVLILVDDATRPTPTGRIIPHVVKRLLTRTSQISFATAPGTHRPLTHEELKIKIGKDYIDRYPVYNVNYKEKEKYHYVTTSSAGTPVYLHECMLDAEYVICIGNIAPHNVVGWSGGAKMIQPGISGEETTQKTHLNYSLHDRLLDIIGNVHCPARQEIDEIGTLARVGFIINTVLDKNFHILGLFSGHHIKAHRAGVAFAENVLCPKIPEKADIVIAGAYPNHVDYWQGFKPLAFSLLGLKKGGTVIFIIDPPEGLCSNSPTHKETLYQYLRSNQEQVIKDLKAKKISDVVGITNPLGHYQILEHANIICVTQNLTQEECELCSFTKIDTFSDALREAFRRQGANAKVGLIPCSGETVVKVQKSKPTHIPAAMP